MSDDSAFDILRETVDKASTNFAKSLEQFRAWHGGEGITEANIALQLALAFTKIHENENAIAFVEVAFARVPGGRIDNHLDLYLATKDIAFMIEAKCLWCPENARSIESDIARLDGKLLFSISERHQDKLQLPRRCHGVIITDAWDDEIVNWWNQKEPSKCKWSREGFPLIWQYGSQPVLKINENPKGTIHWLFGMSPDLKVAPTTA